MLARWCRASLLSSGACRLRSLLNVSPAASAAEAWQPDPKLVEAARKEGQALWYTTLIVDQIVRPLIKEFQARVPGIDVKFIRAESNALVVRLTNEARAGRVQSDLWSLIDGVDALTHEGIAAPLDLPSANGLPPTLLDPNRHWVATNLASRSLAYNTTLIPQEQAPRTYADLLDPRWKGKFAWHPTAMAGGWGFIATVLAHMGDDEGMAYLRKLAKQDIVPLGISTRAVLDRVIAGEYPMGLEMVNAHVALSVAKGAPVQLGPARRRQHDLASGRPHRRRAASERGAAVPRLRGLEGRADRFSARRTTSPCTPTSPPCRPSSRPSRAATSRSFTAPRRSTRARRATQKSTRTSSADPPFPPSISQSPQTEFDHAHAYPVPEPGAPSAPPITSRRASKRSSTPMPRPAPRWRSASPTTTRARSCSTPSARSACSTGCTT